MSGGCESDGLRHWVPSCVMRVEWLMVALLEVVTVTRAVSGNNDDDRGV